jgi:hypothetical protein
MTEIQAQLEDLKVRMTALEAAEIRLRVQSVGPRGAIGPAGVIGERGESIRGSRGSDGKTGAVGRDGRDAVVDYNEIEARLIQVLIDYGLISQTVGPLKKFVPDTNYKPHPLPPALPPVEN